MFKRLLIILSVLFILAGSANAWTTNGGGSGGGDGSSVWGSITGDIEDQDDLNQWLNTISDLQDDMDGKVNVVPAVLGANAVAIDNSCTGWTFGSGWQCGGDGTILKNADGVGTASYSAGEADGTVYNIVYTLTGLSGGSVTASLGGSTFPISSTSSAYITYVTAQNTSNLTFTPSITGVRLVIASVYAYPLTNGKIIAFGGLKSDQPIISRFISSKKYKAWYIDPFDLGASLGTPGIWWDTDGFGIGDPTNSIDMILEGRTVMIHENGIAYKIDAHIVATPSVITGAGCGASPTLTNADDGSGTINAGSGVLTSCVFTMGGSYTNNPVCTFQPSDGTVLTSIAVDVAANVATWTIQAASLTSKTIRYVCVNKDR